MVEETKYIVKTYTKKETEGLNKYEKYIATSIFKMMNESGADNEKDILAHQKKGRKCYLLRDFAFSLVMEDRETAISRAQSSSMSPGFGILLRIYDRLLTDREYVKKFKYGQEYVRKYRD